MSRSFLSSVANTGVVLIHSRFPWLGHKGLSSSFLSQKSREGELGPRETCDYGGCNASMPVALASDLCLFSMPHPHSCLLQKGWGGSSLAPPFHSFRFCPLVGLLSPHTQSEELGSGVEECVYLLWCNCSNLRTQIQQIIVVFWLVYADWYKVITGV